MNFFLSFFLFFSFYFLNYFSLQFFDFSYEEILKYSFDLKSDFANINEADKLFGNELKSKDCSPIIIQISDLKIINKLIFNRPQVVISGEIHGDERVGPTSSIFLAELLVHASLCKIQLQQTSCEKLLSLSITNEQINWLTFLATKRDTFILPTPNCMGYLHKRRYDEGVDPNRDFPYSRRDNKCLLTKTSLLFDSLFRNITPQILVTFHGGMSAIGYEWGSMQHPQGRDKSPDHLAHSTISQAFINYASGFRNEKPYSAAPINSIVYPVYGGMEDWAYAAGWDTSLNVICNGKSSRSTPPPNRIVTFLVETSDSKTPLSSEMGQDTNILSLTQLNKYSGHVPRNTRLSLVAIDTVQPYVCISLLKTISSFDISWYVGGGFNVIKTWISWHLLPNKIYLNLNNNIELSSSEKSGILEEYILSSINPTVPIQSNDKWIQSEKTLNHASGWFTGKARWLWKDPFNNKDEGLFHVKGVQLPENLNQFHHNHNNNHNNHNNNDINEISNDSNNNNNLTLMLIAWAEVDSDWGQPGQGFPNSIEESNKRKIRYQASTSSTSSTSRNLRSLFPPQSHLSNARSNPNWKITNSLGQIKIQGRKYFPSDPIIVTIDSKYKLRGTKSFNIESYVEDCNWWDRKRL